MIDFDDQVVIVTGAGNGLGKAYALEFARRGAAVVVNDLGGSVSGEGGSDAAQSVVDEIVAAGGRAAASRESVATPEGGKAIVATAIDAFGRVDVVVNNAGILRDKSFLKLEPEDLNAVLDVHLKGAFNVSQPAFAHMKAQGYGRLVFTSSNAGVFGNFGQTNYGAAKAGLVGLSNVLAIEGERFGIKSNAVMPIAKTRMTEELLGPLADRAAPEGVVPLVVYLSSRECELTHEVFSAALGRYARVFIGVTPGWKSDGLASAEDIQANLAQIEEQAGYAVPLSTLDELKTVLE
ncbi:SDR family NAD(P)-dependent oxidoreductase [Antrihabitans cavernicola]|uniref:SDR family NAD(P)-dependent oxidoreductase n=1 Tax=Antrihabitans cavernicola TaxID=2495913 RepID=A0A5A7S5K8_9NOCA|nr:SDR family NAD(P)-dependent oxidoreductase [Spelaeibacter cavernicola]KAA0021156.1 SDR family NAD(P)-dependent oxidoreductase [Spelaeibacter cavernicola]